MVGTAGLVVITSTEVRPGGWELGPACGVDGPEDNGGRAGELSLVWVLWWIGLDRMG